jgi:hypothetical protein
MKQMTTNQYSYDGREISYLLPFDYKEQSEQDLLEQSKELFNIKSFYRVQQLSNTIDKYNDLVLEYLYEGYGEYHRFHLRFEVVYLTDIKRLVLSGSVEQGVHDLFDVIIHDSILPDFVKTYNLKEYNYYDFNKYNG